MKTLHVLLKYDGHKKLLVVTKLGSINIAKGSMITIQYHNKLIKIILSSFRKKLPLMTSALMSIGEPHGINLVCRDSGSIGLI